MELDFDDFSILLYSNEISFSEKEMDFTANLSFFYANQIPIKYGT